MIALYTNNKVATLQAANDFDGIIAMADALLAKNAENALAQKVRLQAYASKKDYNKVIELGEAAAKVQTDPEDVSLMYLTLGAAYNAKEMKPQAIEAFQEGDGGTGCRECESRAGRTDQIACGPRGGRVSEGLPGRRRPDLPTMK